MNASSTIGTLQQLVGNSSPQLTTIISLMTIERALNYMTFNRERLKKTVRSIYETAPSMGDCKSCFFKKAEKKESIEMVGRVEPQASPDKSNIP